MINWDCTCSVVVPDKPHLHRYSEAQDIDEIRQGGLADVVADNPGADDDD